MRPNQFQDPFHGSTGIYHFASDHLEKRLLFREVEEFRFGVNTLAIGTTRFPDVAVLCYTLMSNHIHVLLRGDYQRCCAYFRWVLKRLAMMVREAGVLGLNAFDVQPVMDNRQFRNEVAYILRNCYKARICSPFSYRWSSADVYFNPYRDDVRAQTVQEYSLVQMRTLFHTRERLPDSFQFQDGLILNRCFVDYAYVEKRIGDSLAYFDALRVWDLESSVALSHGVEEQIRFSDEELSGKVSAICREEFHVSDIQRLDRKSLLMMARTLSRRFGAGKAQLGRILGIEQDILGKVL